MALGSFSQLFATLEKNLATLGTLEFFENIGFYTRFSKARFIELVFLHIFMVIMVFGQHFGVFFDILSHFFYFLVQKSLFFGSLRSPVAVL